MAKKDKKKSKKVHGNLGINLTRADLISENEQKANRLFSLVSLFASLVTMLCLGLNEWGIFVIDITIMRVTCITAAVLFLLPFIVVFILRRKKKWVKYFLVAIVLAISLLLYSVLSYHVMMIWLLPLVISLIYFDKKLLDITIKFTSLSIIIGHLIACKLLVIVDDPLRDVKAAMLYGALPRVIIFLVIAMVGWQVINKSSDIFDYAIDNSKEIGRMTDGIQLVMKQTQTLMGTRDMHSLASLIANSISDGLMSMLHLTEVPAGVVGLLVGEEYYTVDSIGTPNNVCRDLGDEIGFEFNNARFKFQKFVRDASSVAEVREGFIVMKFYSKGTLTGFVLYKQEVDADDYSLREVIDIFCTNTTSIIDNTMLTFDMFRTQEQLAYSLAVISESSSQETGQHIRRVSEYAKIMGKYVCESEEQLETFRIAAMLHDIGKLMIPKEIIEKPGRLTAEEFGVMKKHVIFGRDIIGNAPGDVMEMARHIILHHHERWDGTGYLGVTGEDIDKFARYVSVCDVFDALLSRRSYKDAWPAQKVYEEITSQSGRQFDPQAVNVFKQCYMEMLQIRDKFPDDELDEENILSNNQSSQSQQATEQQIDANKKVVKQLPKINVDPSIVTPISI